LRAIIQKVSKSAVLVEDKVTGRTGLGLVIFAGITHSDSQDDIRYIVEKSVNMRLFPAKGMQQGFDRSAVDVNAEILLVSQFTLHAITRKGRRPSFTDSAPSEISRPIFETLHKAFNQTGLYISTGIFGAYMSVEMINDGPVTIIIDSADRKISRRQPS